MSNKYKTAMSQLANATIKDAVVAAVSIKGGYEETMHIIREMKPKAVRDIASERVCNPVNKTAIIIKDKHTGRDYIAIPGTLVHNSMNFSECVRTAIDTSPDIKETINIEVKQIESPEMYKEEKVSSYQRKDGAYKKLDKKQKYWR